MKVSYNTKRWLHGLGAAFVSGVGTYGAGLVADVEPAKILKMMVITVGMTVGAYLKQFPLPDMSEKQTPNS